MPAPLVSVVLPVYNGEPYLAGALESILRQDHDRLEVIAIDDGSTDGSLETLQRYRKADGRVSIISRENRGLVATLNEGLALARGELVARMDADDFSYPSRLSRQVAVFARQPHCGFCGSGIDMLVGNRLVRGASSPIYRTCDLRVLALFFTIFIHSTVVYNRRAIPDDLLRYDPGYLHAEDFDLFRRIAERAPAAMIEESLVAYRIHETSVTSKHKQQMRRTHLRIVSENLQREGLAAAPDLLRGIGEAVTRTTVHRAADFLLALDSGIAALPDETRRSYEEGALNLFYFLYQLINDAEKPALTHEFLSRTGKWDIIRRREKYGLLAAVQAPWLSRFSITATRRIDAVSRYCQSIPAATILPSCRAG